MRKLALLPVEFTADQTTNERMAANSIFRVNFDRNKKESCGFHRSND